MTLLIVLIVVVNICFGTCAYHFVYVNETYNEMVVTGLVLPIIENGPTPVSRVNAVQSGRKRVLITESSLSGVVGSAGVTQVDKTASYSTPDGPTSALFQQLAKKANVGLQKRLYDVANPLYPNSDGIVYKDWWTLDTGVDLNIVTTDLADALQLRQSGKCDPQFRDHPNATVVHGVGSVLAIGTISDGPQFPVILLVCNLLGNSFVHETGMCECLRRAEGYVQCP